VNGFKTTRKAQPTLLRQLNSRAVFELVRRHGTTSRADLTRSMGISAPTVAKALNRLLRAGLLEEIDAPPAPGAGRPAKAYRVAGERMQVLGTSFDTSRCVVSRGSLNGNIDSENIQRFPTPRTYRKLIEMVAERAKEFMSVRGTTTLGMGISAPGAIDVPNQIVVSSPNLHLLDGQSPSRDLATLLGIEVVMFHDTVAACLAEQQYGMARDLSDFVQIGVHQGVGVSVVSGGRLLEGRQGMAGELGHVTVDLNGPRCGCGNRGCLETLATDVAFGRRVCTRLGREIEVDEIIRLAKAGEIDVDAELDETLEYLAVGLGAAINIFNPAAVLLSSRMLDIHPTVYDRLKSLTARHALKTSLEDVQFLLSSRPRGSTPIAGIIYHLTNSIGPHLH
jgi:N-acetylglucosamine repressor